MKFETMPDPIRQSQHEDGSRERNYARSISILLFVIALPIDAYFTYALTQTQDKFLLLGLWAGIFLTIAALIALRINKTAPVSYSTFLIGASVAGSAIAISYLLKDFGLVIGAAAMIGIFQVTGLTLKSRNSRWGILIGVIAGVGSILVDLSNDPARLELPSLRTIITIVAIFATLIQTTLILREFPNYALRTKLVITFLLVAVTTIGVMVVIVNGSNRTILIRNAGLNLTAETRSRALIVGDLLSRELQGLQSLGISRSLRDQELAANAEYLGKSDSTILTEILQLDDSWQAAGAGGNALINSVLTNSISGELKLYQDHFPANVELFLTDKYGANLSATNRTSDYYQADEVWWQAAYDNGKGAVFIGQPAYDESSSTYASIIAIPVYSRSGQEVVGILRSTLAISEVTTILKNADLGGTASIDLYVADGIKIPTAGGQPVPGEHNALVFQPKLPSYIEVPYVGVPSLISRAQINAFDPNTSEAIQNLGWSLVTHQNLNEILAQSRDQNRTLTLVSILLLGIVAVSAFYGSQLIARPLQELTTVTEQISNGNLEKRAFIRTQDEIGQLANSFNQMADSLKQNLTFLEQSVDERTQELDAARRQSERRADELQSISEISRLISAEQNLKVLMSVVPGLVSERFGFYHTGLFLLDETRKFAILEAASSEGGRVMLARNHRLEVGGSGIVGYVAKSGMPRIALDVGQDAVYFDNPDLPETRSEMALPLKFRGAVNGVLDIQSKVAGAFTDQELNTMNILADQISRSIENARLFQETQEALLESESLYRQNIRENWSAFSKEEPTIGYHQKLTGGNLISTPVDSEEIRQVMNRGDLAVLSGVEKSQDATLVVPIKLRGQVIGVIRVVAPETPRNWSSDEVTLTEIISERLSLALENARLVQESQSRAAKEQVISEVTSRISSSINLKNILQTAVEELGNAIPGSEVLIKLQGNNHDNNRSNGE